MAAPVAAPVAAMAPKRVPCAPVHGGLQGCTPRLNLSIHKGLRISKGTSSAFKSRCDKKIRLYNIPMLDQVEFKPMILQCSDKV